MKKAFFLIAIAAGLTISPLLAFNYASAPRSVSANVVAHASGHVASATLAPTLCATNAYIDDAMSVTHQYVTGMTMDVVFTKQVGASRFSIVAPSSGSLSKSTSFAVKIRDTDSLHPTGTFSVTLDADVTMVRSAGALNVGYAKVTRTFDVVVATVC